MTGTAYTFDFAGLPYSEMIDIYDMVLAMQDMSVNGEAATIQQEIDLMRIIIDLILLFEARCTSHKSLLALPKAELPAALNAAVTAWFNYI